MLKKILLGMLLMGGATQACQLLIKIPTRSRPVSFFKALDLYYQNLSGQIDVNFLITCDIDDQSMNNPMIIQKLKTYPNLFFYFGKNFSKIEAYNNDINKHLDFDALLVTSDDTKPAKNYDKKIMDLMIFAFPDFDGIINFNDGHQKSNLNTLPIIGKKFYARFGYVFYPEYKALNCDQDLTLVSKQMGKEYYTNEIIIEHLHPAWNTAPNDALYEKSKEFIKHDESIFHKRKALGLI